MLCVLDNTRNKVSDLTDSALFQDESEPAESKHVQISKQDFSCKPGLAACLKQQHQGSGGSLFNIYWDFGDLADV